MMIRDHGNANWWARRVMAFGWAVDIRVRRKGRRRTYRKWFMVEVFNYNHSEEDIDRSHGQMTTQFASNSGGSE